MATLESVLISRQSRTSGLKSIRSVKGKEQKLFEHLICHKNQASLVQAVANCEHRSIGSGGGFGYTSILEGADISLLESVTLAHWLCANAKEKKKQIIRY